MNEVSSNGTPAMTALEGGGAAAINADQVTMTGSGAGMVRADYVEFHDNSGAGLVIANKATVAEGGRVGLLISRSAEGAAKPLLDPRTVLVLLIGVFIGRRLRRR